MGVWVWDGNAIKLGCDDRCTTINVIKVIEFKKKTDAGVGEGLTRGLGAAGTDYCIWKG